MKKIKKVGICPKCEKTLYRKRSIRIRDIKPTKCNYCGEIIKNPYEIFKPKYNETNKIK